MKKLKIAALSVLFLSIILNCSSSCTRKTELCKTKYPVLLVHGIAFRDKTVLIKYWGSIPKKLKQNGAKIYLGGQEAYGTCRENAKILKKNVQNILKETGVEKVNIIAHSKGGIESRYLISKLGISDKIASLTTIATPHRGSKMADIILKGLPGKKIIGKLIDLYAKLIGDDNPMSVKAGKELTIAAMKKFNRDVPDIKSVYYQSYSAQIDASYINPLWNKMQKTMSKYEGDNDGLVSVKSSKWGNYRGVVTCKGKFHVSHADIVGLQFLSGEFCFDADEFFINILKDLKKRGY